MFAPGGRPDALGVLCLACQARGRSGRVEPPRPGIVIVAHFRRVEHCQGSGELIASESAWTDRRPTARAPRRNKQRGGERSSAEL